MAEDIGATKGVSIMSVKERCGAIVLLGLLVTASTVKAQEFTGTYTISGEMGIVTLTLQQDASGAVQGQMTGGGMAVSVQGDREDPGISGTASTTTGETYGFVAQLGDDGHLYLKLFPFDYMGNPLYDYAETLIFAQQAGGQAEAAPAAVETWEPGAATEREFYINRVKLPSERVQQMELQYKTLLMDGRYWYDEKCGAWGVEGGPTLGFIFPGLDLPGPMPADISGGGTGIFINGREIHVQDQMALQQIFGVTIPGRYWLDAQGNLGIEGGMAIANLAQAMQAAAGNQYGSAYGAGGTVGKDSEGFMFSGRTLGKSVFWYSGQ
jgi:hypothetical protein